MRIPQASELFILGIEGLSLNSKEKSFIKDHPLGGVILFKRNISSLKQLIDLNSSIIETNPHYCPLICVDQEGGRVARLSGICSDLPPMRTMQAKLSADPALAYRLGALQGRELVSLGFNLNFSPVCDIELNPENQVIGDRAFADCPDTVGLLASNLLKGMQAAGIAACAKHFPGHGRSAIDSHFALPSLDIPLELLLKQELVPFKAAIAANVATIMTAHILNPALDTVPATLSAKTLQDLLRKRMEFANVIISDDLDMKALADHYSLPDMLKQGLSASVDLFIIGNDFDKGIKGINYLQDLIDSDETIRSCASSTAERLDGLRGRYLGKPAPPLLSIAQEILRSKPHLELIKLMN